MNVVRFASRWQSQCNDVTGEVHIRYRVVLQQSEEGYTVSCPGLPGCCSQGETEQEALENIKSAIEEYLAAVAEMTAGKDVRIVEVSAA